MSDIELRSVSKYYERKKVIDSLSIQFEMGKIHVIIGPSSSGKSTLLKLISGLIPSSFGEVWIGNTTIDRIGRKERVRLFGHLIQNGGLFPHLTVQQNIILPAQVVDMDYKWVIRRVSELCEQCEIDRSMLGSYPDEISEGQKQKASLVRALILNPNILLLDEPMSNLDPISKKKLQKELKNILKNLKKTVVMVTHDLVEASYFNDSVSLINEGRVVQTGKFRDLYVEPVSSFVRDFIQSQVIMSS